MLSADQLAPTGASSLEPVPGLQPEDLSRRTGGDVRIQHDFEVFYAQAYADVLKHALWLERDLSSAEDLTQDGFVAAHARWDYVSGLEWPTGWVHRVVSNRSVSRYRSAVRDSATLLALHRRRPLPATLDDERAALWDAVRRLPRRQAQVVALMYGCGYTAPEIASILECGEETVRTHLNRARRALAAALDPDSDPNAEVQP